MRFSQRIGKTPKAVELQIERIDADLRNRLWNAFCMHILSVIKRNTTYDEYLRGKDVAFIEDIYHSFFKDPIDEVPSLFSELQKRLKNRIFKQQWYEVYDFLEFTIKSITYREDFNKEVFVIHLNEILEEEFSGFRIVNNLFCPVSNQQELDEVEQALNFTSIDGVNIHLTNALEKLSDKKQPDFRNSIKESISAVECVCRELTGESTLGKALKKLESSGIDINQQLKTGFEKIYAYTNDKESGIRHSIMEGFKNPDFEDAKYMLVACSSFVNYLVGKNIKLKS